MLDAFREAVAGGTDRHVAELRRLVEIPSVSAEGRGLDDAAAEVVGLLEARGLRTEVHPTPGAPVITAFGGAAEGPTLLFYEHYDVQPADPLELWTTPPFELVERDGKLYGRGSADTKGNLVCRLAAIDAARQVFGDDPIRYAWVIEGEEEIGSVNLPAFLEANADALRADGCLWEFGAVDPSGRPQVIAGLKGIATLELRCRLADRDLHSSYGAVIDNPLYRLSAAIASLRDDEGRVSVEAFYDDVVAPTQADEAALAAMPDESGQLAKLFGVAGFLGGAGGADFQRRLQLEPCVNVNGIHGGYGGPGSKTVLPAEAVAKLDVRLVEAMRPERVTELLRRHLDRHGFTDVELVPLEGYPAGRTPLDDPFVRLVARAASIAYGIEPVLACSSGGSGPAYPFREFLKVPFATAGCAYAGSQFHAPDEHIRKEDFDRGRLHSALVISELANAR